MFIEMNDLPLDTVDCELKPERVETEIVGSGRVQPDAVVRMDFDVASRLPLFEHGLKVGFDGHTEPRRHLLMAVVIRQNDAQIIRFL